MPALVLNPWQVQTLLDLAGAGPRGPGSPLRMLARYPRPAAPGEPDFDWLATQGLVIGNGPGWRVNSVAAGVMRACAAPDEVLSVAVAERGIPGFSVVRRGRLWSECTVGRGGETKLSFPLSRSAVFLTVIGALSGNTPEPPSSGFRFVGPAGEAFVIGCALRLASRGRTPVAPHELAAAVAADAADPRLAAGFALTAGPESVEALAGSPPAVEAAIGRLATAGHLVRVGDGLAPSPAALAALGGDASVAFGITHTEVTDKWAASASIQVTRCGARTVAFRIGHHHGEAPRFEWAEVTREQLRELVAALILPGEAREALLEGKKAGAPPSAPAAAVAPPSAPPAVAPAPPPAPPAAVAPAPPPAPPAAVAPAPPPAPPAAVAPASPAAWSPTHRVPPGGLPARAAPDAALAPSAELGAGTPLQVLERRGAWAEVAAENGWRGWVDGRRLEDAVAPALPAAWSPTHRVPPGGLPARAAPDAALAPSAELGAGTPLQVVERRGAWAEVAAENGWRGWVDGRRLEPV